MRWHEGMRGGEVARGLHGVAIGQVVVCVARLGEGPMVEAEHAQLP